MSVKSVYFSQITSVAEIKLLLLTIYKNIRDLEAIVTSSGSIVLCTIVNSICLKMLLPGT